MNIRLIEHQLNEQTDICAHLYVVVMLIRSTAHPSYCPSELYCPSGLLQHLTYDSCRSDGHIFLPIRPIQQLLSCLQRSRVEIINCSCRTANQFCRSDVSVGQMGSIADGQQDGWAVERINITQYLYSKLVSLGTLPTFFSTIYAFLFLKNLELPRITGWEGYNDMIQYWRKGLELARSTGWEGYNYVIQYWRKGLELARTTGWEGYNYMIQYWRKGLELARTTGWEG